MTTKDEGNDEGITGEEGEEEVVVMEKEGNGEDEDNLLAEEERNEMDESNKKNENIDDDDGVIQIQSDLNEVVLADDQNDNESPTINVENNE